MFKSVYDFTKAFSVLFFLTGISFLFNEMYWVAFITMFSFFAIKFIDSDWAFDNFKFSNHNLVVIIITFGLIFVNIFAIYQELKFSPFLSRLKNEDKESYIVYENALYSAIEPCALAHNSLYEKMNSGEKITEKEVNKANNLCDKAARNIDNQVIPGNLTDELKYLCTNLQIEFKKMSINLSIYKYISDSSQIELAQRIKKSLNTSINNMQKIREIMQIKEELEDEKRMFIQL